MLSNNSITVDSLLQRLILVGKWMMSASSSFGIDAHTSDPWLTRLKCCSVGVVNYHSCWWECLVAKHHRDPSHYISYFKVLAISIHLQNVCFSCRKCATSALLHPKIFVHRMLHPTSTVVASHCTISSAELAMVDYLPWSCLQLNTWETTSIIWPLVNTAPDEHPTNIQK